MQLCSACLAVRAGDGDTARHAVLQITDTRRSKLPNEGIVTVSTFRCQACGACWTYREGKRALNPGGQLQSPVAPDGDTSAPEPGER